MTTQMTVLGATGGIGAAITRAAEARPDLTVRAVNRGGDAATTDGTERVAADIEQLDDARRAVTGTDVVVLAAQPPYHDWGNGRWERMLDNVLTATSEVGAKLVFVDNLYAFDGTAGPVTEDSPRATNRKGVLRDELAQRALAAHDRGDLRVTIGCFSDYFGPGEASNSSLNMVILQPALAGRRMRAVYELDVPHVFAYLPDTAEMFLTLALDPRADGRRWVLPHGEALTQRQVQQLVADAAGRPARHGRYGPAMMWLGGLLDKDIREVRVVRAQWEQPWLVDGTAFTQTFGPHHVTPMRDAIAATVAVAQQQAAAGTTPREAVA